MSTTIRRDATPPEGAVDLMKSQNEADAVGQQLRAAGGQSQPQDLREVARSNGIPNLLAESSVLLQAPDGRYIEVGPPAQSTVFMVSRILGSAPHVGDATPALVMMDHNTVRSLMYVRALDGQMIPMPTTWADTNAIANLLGDVGVDLVIAAVSKFWRLATVEDLPVIKKNLR